MSVFTCTFDLGEVTHNMSELEIPIMVNLGDLEEITLYMNKNSKRAWLYERYTADGFEYHRMHFNKYDLRDEPKVFQHVLDDLMEAKVYSDGYCKIMKRMREYNVKKTRSV